jgi:hypothetical protein
MLRQHETAWVANKRPAVDAQRGQAQGLQDTRNIRDIHGFQSNNMALRLYYFAYLATNVAVCYTWSQPDRLRATTQERHMAKALGRLEISEFGCIQTLTLELSRFHALIGPPDSGKSTIQRALQHWSPRYAEGLTSTQLPYLKAHSKVHLELASGPPDMDCDPQMVLIRFSLDELRKPSPLLPPEKLMSFVTARGKGLPAVYDHLRGAEDTTYAAIVEQLCQLFPVVKKLRIVANDGHQKTLELELRSGDRVSQAAFGEGLLSFLAFAALPYLGDPFLYLIEQPELGLHPARIRGMMAILRAVSEKTPILMATHSPLVVNELAGDEITVLRRDPARGTVATRLDQTPSYAARASVYDNGELWARHCDGDQEAALFAGMAR